MRSLTRFSSCGWLVAVCSVITGCFLDPSRVSGQPSAVAAAEQRLIADAARLTQEGDVTEALTAYETLLRQFPNSEFGPEARLRLAWGRWEEGNSLEAMRLAQELVDQSIDKPQAAGGFVLLGEAMAKSARDRKDIDHARDALRNAWTLFDRESFPNLEWRTQALVRSAELAFSLGEYESAAVAYLAVIEDESESSLTRIARLNLGECMLQLGELSAAARLFQEVVDSSDSESSDASTVVATALRRNSLLHRLWLRPAAGSRPWSRARYLSPGSAGFKKPHSVAASADGRLIVADSSLREVVVLSEAGEPLFKSAVKFAQRPAFDLAGAPISVTGERVVELESRASHTFVDPDSKRAEPLNRIKAAEQGRFGAWTILTTKPARVLLYDSSDEFRSALFDKQRGEVVDLAHDRQGRVYLLDQKRRAVFRLASGGASLERVLEGDWSKAAAMDIDMLGNIYVLDRGEAKIHVYDSAGNRIQSFGPNLPGGVTLKAPEDLAVDGSGRVYVADPRLSAIVVVE